MPVKIISCSFDKVSFQNFRQVWKFQVRNATPNLFPSKWWDTYIIKKGEPLKSDHIFMIGTWYRLMSSKSSKTCLISVQIKAKIGECSRWNILIKKNGIFILKNATWKLIVINLHIKTVLRLKAVWRTVNEGEQWTAVFRVWICSVKFVTLIKSATGNKLLLNSYKLF